MERLADMLSAADLALVCLDKAFTGFSVPSKTYGVLASGTPLLGFLDPQSEIGQMITEVGCGLVLAEPNGMQVAMTIRALQSQPDQLLAMGQAGRKAFLDRYTLSHAAQAYDGALLSMSRTTVKTAPHLATSER